MSGESGRLTATEGWADHQYRTSPDRAIRSHGWGVMGQEGARKVATLSVALEHASRLLASAPVLAERQAAEILGAVPDQPGALLVLGTAQRRQGRLDESARTLGKLAALQPGWSDALYEYALTLAALGQASAAIANLTQVVRLRPETSDAWRALGDQHRLAGDQAAADAAYAEQIRHSTRNPLLMTAAASLCANRLAVAERQLKDYLKRFPTDVVARRMLAELASRIGRTTDAETLLRHCLELAPEFHAARANLAFVLNRQNQPVEALAEIDRLLAAEPGDPQHRMLRASALVQIGEYEEAIRIYGELLASYPNQPKGWMSYGHALKTEGRLAESIGAYRRSLAQEPSFGEAWWSLANLKTVRFTPEDIATMRAQLDREGLGDEDRLHLHFALGKALEDAGNWADSFTHYVAGNAIRHRQLGYQAGDTTERVDRLAGFFTPAVVGRLGGAGAPDPDPIFVVGLPRSGSTLIEQILASHSQVEGTMELPDIPSLVRRLGGRQRRGDPSRYPEMLAGLDGAALTALGHEYLERTRVQRKTGRPFFIDKMPNNFLHVGLIRLILPRAKVIDARRHPLAACFSGFKQHFARGQGFTYGLEDIGRYYVDYVRTMTHFERVLPGFVHLVQYERMVEDTEAETRRLLEFCGLAFEESCLRFHENTRSVRTASAQQVRQPIFSEGLEHWRHYEPWLGPLKAVLGPVADVYPNVPAGEWHGA